MAVRSGAGTGVVVSLVVFIIASLTLFVLAIAFHMGRTEARQARSEAEAALSRFIQPQQRQQDVFRRYEDATPPGQSVVGYMHNRIENLMRYVEGNPGATFESVQGRFSRFGVGPEGVVAAVMQENHRTLQQQRDEIQSLTNQRDRLDAEMAELRAQMDRLRESHRAELASLQDSIAGYRRAADEYRDELNATKRTMNEAVDRLRDQYENRVDELVRETDEFSRQVVALETRIEELQQRLSADRLRAQDPSTLVDGRIIDVSGAADTVFIDRGRRHRIVLGMTFEVYDDAAAIRVDPRTGEIPRGKASIQITRVGEETSTAKIIRSVPGRPVIRDNVIANAVYDPNHTFKFLVHGRFDIDGDGRATELEAEYVRNMVIEWGGEVVLGEEIPGDLDFLVLGVPPEEPPLLGDNPTDFMLADWSRKRHAQATYNRLLEEARRAQIPVLNANRFFILTGHTFR